MAGQTPNLSFVRDGRPLHEWLVDLTSPEPGVRSRAGDAVSAMFYGLASVHAEPEDVEGELPAGEAHTDAWRDAVREAVSRPEFPRRTFFRAAAAQLVGAHADWMRLAKTIDPQYERVLARLQARAAAARSDDERHGVSRRIGRAARASCGREQARRPPEIAAFSMGNIALGWLIESAGPALLEAPEAIWMLLEMRGQEYVALRAIERIGADAAPMFGDWFLNGFDAGMPGVLVNGLDALVAVLRDDPRLHRRVLDRLESAVIETGEQAVDEASFHQQFYDGHVWSAALTAAAIGQSLRRAAEVGDRFLPVAMALSQSPRPGYRGAAAVVLGSIARDARPDETRVVVERLLRMTHDHPWVVGRAIEALGQLRAMPDVVVPRLIELFGTFQEFDPDESYGGEHARVCRALAGFGPSAAPAVPWLLAELHRSRDSDPDTAASDVVSALAAIGPAAAEALPELQRLAAGRDDLAEDDSPGNVRAAIRRIRGG